MAKLDPEVADDVPWSEDITPYDEEHFVTYLRLLDADAEHADWREVARIVLHRDVAAEPERARHCWEVHLARAKWMTGKGYRKLLEQAADLRDSSCGHSVQRRA
ncbi:MAG: DUF2285 domain-containing protein [Alphaproteobacteria bacterium]|nr:DUF2285 domain-containing protein [Alphaproteobacteria bacterium]